ncbi:MAG TPA: hypothetical protein VF426_03700 [Marmoricola sp.]
MISLTRVELTRYLSRRGVALVLLAGIIVIGALAAKTAWDTRPPSASELSNARAQAALAADDPQVKAEVIDCRKHPSRYLGPQSTIADCARELQPTARSMIDRRTLSLHRVAATDGPRVAVLLAAAIVIGAATFVGADWGTGSMRTQLLARPRRGQVWVAKATAVTLASAVYLAIGFALYWLVVALVADARGISTDADTVRRILGLGGRAVALGAGVGLGSFALTMLFRHTVATLGLLFAYAAGGEVLIALLPIDGASRWSVGNNMFGWLKSGFSYLDQSLNCRSLPSCDNLHPLSHLDAGWFLGVLLVIAVAASVASFIRRDV